MDNRTRQIVRERADERCEYCLLQQVHYPQLKHQTEHIIPLKHHGTDDLENLALACVRCNLSKSSNLTRRVEDEIVPLFNPRTQVWREHFEFRSALILGMTPTGRATVDVLCMNEPQRLRLRKALLANGELD